VTSILRDVRLDGWQFGDLMAPRIAHLVARLQTVRTLATGIGHDIHDRVHPIVGDERAVVPGMARLTARFASTFHPPPAHTLVARKAIG
jgi:hypothetical protein